MYIQRLVLQNWRSYADATFDFREPTQHKSVVLIGAMNGNGKTSFLMSLYIGLFGRFGLRYCEGFRNNGDGDVTSYRQAISRYRRTNADSEEPTSIDITLKPTVSDADEEEVRVVRRWYFTAKNEPKQGTAFEQVEIYVGGRLQKPGELEKDPLILAHERIERNLFPAHVAPAFFFDGEQALELIENMGEAGIKKAVEVMFGTKIVAEVAETMKQYLMRARSNTGGKRKADDREVELEKKVAERSDLNDRLGTLQAEHVKIEHEKDERERERSQLTEDLARLGGGVGSDASKAQEAYLRAEKELEEAEKVLADAVRSLGLSLGMSRLSPAIVNRLRAEELRESWEGLKRGTLDNKEKVLSVALPEPPENDPLLGNIAPGVRLKVRQRFADALDRIYNPPPPECASEFWLGHVRGESRAKVLLQLGQIQSDAAEAARSASRRTRQAREALDDTRASLDRAQNLPEAAKEMKERIQALNTVNQQLSHKLGAIENENRKLKSDLHILNEQVGRIQEELARLGPEAKRMAVAERVTRAIDALQENLVPTTTARLQDAVTKYFLQIADDKFARGRIHLPVGEAPEIEMDDGSCTLLETISGFEKRSFSIAFSLALSEITRRRLPLVIDTPLGNADSKYRPRTLKALTDVGLDQIIILTHDEEVTPDLVECIRGSVLQTFLVEYRGSERGSVVTPNVFFES
ncbi:MAG: AAA family ATPase [Pirellulaceae bacterium]